MTGQNVIGGGQGEADDDAERVDADHELVSEVQTAGDDRTGYADEHKAAQEVRPNVVSLCGRLEGRRLVGG